MDTQDAAKLGGKRRPNKTFRETLRDDHGFHIAAKRIGLTSLAALLLDIAMIWLLRARLIEDPNTTELIAFTSFAATLVVIYGVLCFVLRILEEFSRYLLERMTE